MKRLAIDFDGVIHKHDGEFGDGVPKYEPVEGARESLESLIDHGYEVMIFSTRLSPSWGDEDVDEQRRHITKWLTDHGFEQGVHYTNMTGCKVPAIAYIDDRGIRFTNWNDIVNYFM